MAAEPPLPLDAGAPVWELNRRGAQSPKSSLRCVRKCAARTRHLRSVPLLPHSARSPAQLRLLLSSYAPFPAPLPLSELVRHLVGGWTQDGLYVGMDSSSESGSLSSGGPGGLPRTQACTDVPPRRRGRPPGSKNRPKAAAPQAAVLEETAAIATATLPRRQAPPAPPPASSSSTPEEEEVLSTEAALAALAPSQAVGKPLLARRRVPRRPQPPQAAPRACARVLAF